MLTRHNALSCDGSVHILRGDIDGKLLMRLFTRAGGEEVDFEEVYRP